MKALDHYEDYVHKKDFLIWMDTQGFEGYVLKGANNLLKFRMPMVLEFWPYGLKRSGCYDLLFECLVNTKYEFFINLDKDEKIKIPLTKGNLVILSESLQSPGGEDFTDILVV